MTTKIELALGLRPMTEVKKQRPSKAPKPKLPRITLREVNSYTPKMAFWLGLNVARILEGKPEPTFHEVCDLWDQVTGQ